MTTTTHTHSATEYSAEVWQQRARNAETAMEFYSKKMTAAMVAGDEAEYNNAEAEYRQWMREASRCHYNRSVVMGVANGVAESFFGEFNGYGGRA